jgi:8-oxo-dGTP pyrophosphatase MutT (NUDIX family)
MTSARADCKEAPRRPPRPRDAASLILLRLEGHEQRVLVGRRPPKARFLPGRYVFPGGALEPGDSRARPASDLSAGTAKLMAVGGRATRARSLAMAAVRETFEETGLLLADAGDVGPVRSSSWSAMRARGVAPALERLIYVGRAITPVRSTIRFHARFFVADARYATGELGGDSELEDLHWCSVNELAQLPTIEVQSFMLAHAISALTGGESETSTKPLFTQRAGRRYIRYFDPPM